MKKAKVEAEVKNFLNLNLNLNLLFSLNLNLFFPGSRMKANWYYFALLIFPIRPLSLFGR